MFHLRFSSPYSDLTSITPAELKDLYPDEPMYFGHSLDHQIGGQIAAGLQFIGFYEDDWGGNQSIDKFLKGFIATRAIKL